eukprot:NODE_809_length_1849_cov_33.976190_g755_i0.p1 GENE.NODE_809_length_1849_cov_33.976190_g755_i0~~NODE_809_length_1849_cov_33.976190_g755_i0.p1  ORF type:complete len:564 (+),score=155.79 NODE_809_length_1849_cov_33.976190_g755_i0:133-1824(+)
MGVCVKQCPAPNFDDLLKVNKVVAYGGTLKYPVFYKSRPVFRRCVPIINEPNSTTDDIKDVVQQFEKQLAFGRFVGRGVDELAAAKVVLILSVLISLVTTFVFVALLRWITAPVVWTLLLAILAVLVVSGFLAYDFSLDLAASPNVDDQQYSDPFLVLAIVVWVIAGIYLLLVVFLLGRIRIAIEIIEMSSKVMAAVRTLPLVPVVSYFVIVIVAVWCLVVTMYLKTASELNATRLTGPLVNGSIEFPEAVVGQNISDVANGVSEVTSVMTTEFVNFTTVFLQNDRAKEYLMLYNLFGFLWCVAFVKAFSFMVIAFVAVFWYFSAPGDNKSVGFAAVPRAVWYVFRYHLGTIAFGSLLIAIIQFIRFLLSQVQKKLQQQVDNPAGQLLKWVLACIQCCLACWERVIKFINRNAYIICCITGKNFCRSVWLALDLIFGHLATMAATNFIADAVFLFCIVFLTVLNTGIAYVLMTRTSLTPDVDVVVLPLLFVGFISYTIASLFMHLFDSVQDTLLLSYCYDKTENNGADKPYFMTTALQSIDGKYNKRSTVVPVASSDTDPKDE